MFSSLLTEGDFEISGKTWTDDYVLNNFTYTALKTLNRRQAFQGDPKNDQIPFRSTLMNGIFEILSL